MLFFRFRTVRPVIAFSLMMPLRQQLQNVFFMGRTKGFLWEYPGVLSLTVPYSDTNDFYFSGHVGTATVYSLEFILQGEKVLAWAALFILVN